MVGFRKISICFIADQPNWAFNMSTRNLVKYLKLFGICANQYYRDTIPMSIDDEYIYVCWWPDVNIIKRRLNKGQKILCRIADMITWNHNSPTKWQRKFRNLVPSVNLFIASSKEIFDSLRAIGIHNVIVVGDSVNVDEFIEKKFVPKNKPIVGWCGNPKALEWFGINDIKGFSVLNCLKNLDEIEYVAATDIPSDKMPEWYRSIDIYVCASRSEGTPIPVLEAMAVGNIVISTNVGVVKEIESPGVFIFDGTSEDLIEKLHEVLSKKEQWMDLGQANRKYIIDNRSALLSALKLWSGIFNVFYKRRWTDE